MSFSFICSFTKLGVRGKNPMDMTGMDRKILYGEATIFERFFTFLIMIPFGLTFPPLWIIAVVIYIIYKIFT